MEIRRLSDTARTAPLGGRLLPIAQPDTPPQRSQEDRAGDQFQRGQAAEADAPFWLVAMSTDRLARRQYLNDKERKAAMRLEQTWLAQLADAARPAVVAWATELRGAPTLAHWQALVGELCRCAGGFPVPRAVWQPGLKEGRGQFLFKLEGNLLQLRPGAPGTIAEWTATVAHETFHHLQQELVTALYRGEAVFAPPLDRLAALYRDGRNVYQTVGPHCPPDRHRRQALEVGAWAYGEAIARALPKRG